MLYLLKHLSRFFFFLFGWRVSGVPVPTAKCIVVAAFHTSNWDFVLCMGSQFYSGRRVRWLGKHTLFRPPLGLLMTGLGGIPVDRSQKQGMVASLTTTLKRESRFVLAIFPEGTRKKTAQWKSGFYQIAMATGATIQAMGLDYGSKTIFFGEVFTPSGNLEKDLKYLHEFFGATTPKYPEKAEKNFTFAD